MKCNFIPLSIYGGIGALALGLLASTPAYAGTNTGSMQVSATVAGSCTVTATPLSFGSLTLATGNTTLTTDTTSVAYDCNSVPTAFTVGTGLYDAQGPGTGTNYSYAMKNGTSYIAYGLDVENSGTFTTGANPSTPANVAVGSGTYTATSATYSIAGQIPATQPAIPGTYDDTVTFTVTY